MVGNLSQHAIDVMHLFGPGVSPAQRVRVPMAAASLNGAPKGVAGLPSLGKGFAGLGSTRSILGAQPVVSDVVGAPSMKVARQMFGGVAVSMVRNIKYIDFITDQELSILDDIMDGVLHDAVKLSQGPLSLPQLARMGHPYGRGRIGPGGQRRSGLGRIQGRIGVSNLAVINKQSGRLARSYDTVLIRRKGGVALLLTNTANYAAYLAQGTKRMKAHGPWTTAFLRHLGEINSTVAKLGKAGYLRHIALEQAEGSLRHA